MSSARPRFLAFGALVTGTLLLAACGGGGADAQLGKFAAGSGSSSASSAESGLSIVAEPPAGSLGEPYPSTPLLARGAVAPVTWSLAVGDLPPGLTLSPDGVLEGTPVEQGRFPFAVRATDGSASATAWLEIPVDALSIRVLGLVFGDAWTGTNVRLSVVGHLGTVSFSAASSGSGGALGSVDGAAATATWRVGGVGGEAVVDTILAVDDATGRTASVDLRVMPHPCPSLVAEFGSSDVWHVRFDGRFGDHAFARDWDFVLSRVGLRDPASTGARGTEADELASFYVRREALRWMNAFYLRESDGRRGTDGLPITFTMDEPPAGYVRPTAGSAIPGGSGRYSVISVVCGSTSGVAGMGFLDSTANGTHENDSPGGGPELGVFANWLVPEFTMAYGHVSLLDRPVGEDDVASLRALLYGLPDPGGRTGEIRYYGEGFGRAVAAVGAHEVGHSCGLVHTNPTTPGSIMNATATISRWTEYAFTPEAVSTLRGALPGPGRTPGVAKPETSPSSMTEGGIEACRHPVCQLRLAPAAGAPPFPWAVPVSSGSR